MKTFGVFVLAIILGVIAQELSIASIGLLAAYLPYDPALSFLIVPVSQLLFSIIAAFLLFQVSGSARAPYIVAYLAAVAAFILRAEIYREDIPGIEITWLNYWDSYLYFSTLIIVGWCLANKSKQAGTRLQRAPV